MLTSCGGGAGPSKTINVEFAEFHFTPDSFTVPAGAEITVNANNTGAVVHSFVIMKLGTSVGEDFGPEDEPNIFWQTEIQPGSKTTVTFTAPTTPGDYQVICRTQGHYVAGMIAKLTVVAAQ
ncbi:MAG: cupredoxin domain-containing protein [Chloroflexota bacterium]